MVIPIFRKLTLGPETNKKQIRIQCKYGRLTSVTHAIEIYLVKS
jgi:hypothetical protein